MSDNGDNGDNVQVTTSLSPVNLNDSSLSRDNGGDNVIMPLTCPLSRCHVVTGPIYLLNLEEP